MSIGPRNSHQLYSHDPWLTYTQRQEESYEQEDFCLCDPQVPIGQVIKKFSKHGIRNFARSTPVKHRIIKEFMKSGLRIDLTRPISEQIRYLPGNPEIAALLEDRHYHERCTRLVHQTCASDSVFSKNLYIKDLYDKLQEKRVPQQAERRIICIPDLKPITALVLASTTAPRSIIPVREMMHRYLAGECMFSVALGPKSFGFFLEFHLPYYAMRLGPLDTTKDHRSIGAVSLRKSVLLPLQLEVDDEKEIYYHEAQISSLCWGPDEWFWTELFLVETYFGSEPDLSTYLNPPSGTATRDPTTRHYSHPSPCWDPRQYWLEQLEVRLTQVNHEYVALIRTLTRRMEAYVRRPEPENERSKHTQTLSTVLETIQTFIDTISSTLDAWDTFQKNQISIFTLYVHNKDTYPQLLESIFRNIGELERSRNRLVAQRATFKARIENFHTVSSLRQTEMAIAQGENIRTLTQMTVYVAFPLLFTAAIFSMDFTQSKDQKKTWEHFFEVLAGTSVLNGTIAWLLHHSYIQGAYYFVKSWVKNSSASLRDRFGHRSIP